MGTTLPHVGKIQKIEQYFTFTSNLVGKSVYISLKDDNSYKLILYHLHTNVTMFYTTDKFGIRKYLLFSQILEIWKANPPPVVLIPK